MKHTHNGTRAAIGLNEPAFAPAPLARAVALMVAMGGGVGAVQAQAAFSPAWFASKGATQSATAQSGRLPNGKPAAQAATTQQTDAARQKLQQSMANLGLTAQSIAAQQARQAAARAAAEAAAGGVPNGLAPGGLVVDSQSLTAGWIGAKGPTQTVDAGRTTVTIEQTQSRAILNWETFNVGRQTTVQFQQQSDWAVLNKVNDPLARPSQIQGQIKGDGTVLIVNRNGIVFSGTSQINTRNLVAAAAMISDDQFRSAGIYSNGNSPSFTEARGKIEVQAGAQITTPKPGSVTVGGGYAMLLGAEVRNDGQITTPSGQTVLAAGDSFTIRKGAGTEGNVGATTVGNEVAASRLPGSSAGTVVNSGLITAATGDITLTGHAVTQAGVLVSTTSTARRGTIHLSTRASDDTGTVTLANGSTTAILLEDSSATALDSQRDAALKDLGAVGNNASGVFDNLSTVVDRRDLSRVEIVSGNTVDFQGGSMTLATGGEMAVTAVKRTLVDKGAALDVSGAVGVKVAMESNNLLINAQGNEQRDAPTNRDDESLNSLDLWVDRRKLVFVPAGTNGYATDRWYTEGGLLEVSGYVATSHHSVGEWMAQGGTVTVTGGDLVTRAGSGINLSGGTLDVAAGVLRQSWIKGRDGRLHEVSSAPGDLLYAGLYRGFSGEHVRWGTDGTEAYYNPLIAPQQRLENGYTVGRDAGKLVVATRSAVLEGTLRGDTYNSPQQLKAPQADLDGYHQSQTAAARGPQLIVGQYRPVYDTTSVMLRHQLSAVADRVSLKDGVPATAGEIQLGDAVAADRQGVITLDAARLSDTGLGAVRLAASRGIEVQADLAVTDGGDITLYAPQVNVAADLTAHSGTIRIGNVLRQPQQVTGNPVQDGALAVPGNAVGGVTVHTGVTLDASGRFTDLRATDGNPALQAHLDGGSVSIRSTDSVSLAKGALIDVSSGAMVEADGSVTGGKGGSVQLGAGLALAAGGSNAPASLILDGDIHGHGVNGGGTLSIESASGIVIGGQMQQVDGVLKAGASSLVDLVLLNPQEIKVPAGGVLPVNYQYIVSHVNPGDLVGATGFKTGVNLVTQADWLPPVGSYTIRVNGNFAQRTDGGFLVDKGLFLPKEFIPFIPKGSVVSFISDPQSVASYAKFVVPADVFPQGVPIPDRVVRFRAGERAPFDLTLQLAAGTRLAAGVVLPTDVAVAPTTTLSTELFQSGFSQYDVRGHLGVAVPDGVALDVSVPVLRGVAPMPLSEPDLAAAFTPFRPALYQENASTGVLTPRTGASLTLSAGRPTLQATVGDAGDLTMGEGARIRVDPGQSIVLSSRGSLKVDGLLEAKGGEIALLGPQSVISQRDLDHGGLVADGWASDRAIELGAQAVLDASAASSVAVDALGRRYGLVTDGGRIVVGGTLKDSGARALTSDAFVVVHEGAVLDASGGSVSLDLPGQGLRTVASHGGDIQLSSANGLVLDGTLRAQAGGAGASGGQLTVALEAPQVATGAEAEVLALRELTLRQQHVAGAAGSALRYGQAALGVDQVREGGFSSLALYSNGLLSLAGNVDLSLDRELRLYAGAIAAERGASPTAEVRLNAPHVVLGGIVDNITYSDLHVRPSYQGGVSTQPSNGTLTVRGQLIDVQGVVTSGLNRTVAFTQEDRAGFRQLNLLSDGDLRFAAGESLPSGFTGNELNATGSILLQAAQVYPGTGVSARVRAGRLTDFAFDPDSRLVIERADPQGADPALPYSVFGNLQLSAAHVEQNGVVRAPLGNITLGTSDASSGSALTVQLGANSLTSVSAAGLVMPYGGTSDGVTYAQDGRPVGLKGVGANGNITLSGAGIDVDRGAVLDLSGGGDLRGAGFVSGRGGSTDARMNPLVQTGKDGFVLPDLASHPVYAIVPGYRSAYAPLDSGGAVAPAVGRQVTIGANDVPGLAAGTYTLLPSHYALLPGAFRVEISSDPTGRSADGAIAMRNGSYKVAGTLGTAHTNQRDSLSSQVIVTPADVLRRYSEYNETRYADFVLQQASLSGTVRAMLPADAKTLNISLPSSADSHFSFDGQADFTPAKGGHGGTATLSATGLFSWSGAIEVRGDGSRPTAGFEGLSIQAGDLNALGAARLLVGGTFSSTHGVQVNGSDQSNYVDVAGTVGRIALRDGAVLRAPEVLLVANSPTGGIDIEAGAGIRTIGAGKAAFDSTDGYVYRLGAVALVGASNGTLNLLAPQVGTSSNEGGGTIRIGSCGARCDDPAELYAEGTLVAATRRSVDMKDNVRFGARDLVLAVGAVNAGSAEELAAAQARGALTPGLTLNQTVLDRLMKGDTAYGAPALQRLVLTAGESINFFGDVTLDTTDPATGKAALNLVLSTPALYGWGDADDVARITTGKLTWAGLAGGAPAPVTGGRGTGTGQLQVTANLIEFGMDATAQPTGVQDVGRTILGFGDVRMSASERITANHKGSLTVAESMVAGSDGPQFQGGNLVLSTPLMTGAGGSVNRITAGGSLAVVAPTGGSTAAVTPTVETGAELSLTGQTVRLDTAVVLPSGKLTVKADGDVLLGDQAQLDLAGREIKLHDISRYSWGGDATLQSATGNVTQSAGSRIDLSAKNNHAGLLSVIALDEEAGRVVLQGKVLGSASGHDDAGGTLVPYRAGGVNIRAQHLGTGDDLTGEFAAFNSRLNEGGVTGSRSFQLKQGDLTIGSELRAHEVSVSLDRGQLTVSGTIDASGEQVGSIRLAAARGLTLAGTAVLDAHGTVLRVDSDGQIIDSPNRATVELDSGTGMLAIGSGARIDLRHGTASTGGDGRDRGTLDLYAPRVGSTGRITDADAATYGDIAIDARGNVTIQGARSIAVYGKQVYQDAPFGTDPAASGRPYQVIDQAYLDGKHAESAQFIDGALANTALLGTRLGGLNTADYRNALHLRPAVEVASATPDGDLIVRGDLDLSGQRYSGLNPNTPKTAVYGSGEVGMLTLRAGGDLSIYGSINDGFAPPPETPDDQGWILTQGVQRFGGDVVVPAAGVTLAEGTTYPAGKTLNYAITAKDVTLPASTLLPSTVTLDRALTLPAGTVLAADVRAADGTVLLAAGSIVGANGAALPAGAQLMAGTRLPVTVTLARLVWPKGTALPVAMVQSGSLALPVGAVIAAGTNVALPDDAAFIHLRHADGSGRQGRNWAVAQMLPEGSPSWSLRLVAGADLEAADARLRNTQGRGHLTLADTHYGVQVTAGGVIAGLNWGGVNEIINAAGGLPPGINDPHELLGKTEAEIVSLYGAFEWGDFGLPLDFWSPSGGNILKGLTLQGVDAVVNVAGGLPPGINDPRELVGKTESELVTLYGAFSWDDFGMPADFWTLASGNGATLNLPSTVAAKSPTFSVVRTGTGDLSLIAGGNFSMRSAYGVYTAGTATSLGSAGLDAAYNQGRGLVAGGSSVLGNAAQGLSSRYEALVSGADSLYKAWYPNGGGNLWVDVGGNLTGDAWSSSGETGWASASVGNWLWRQGTGDTAGVDPVPTAWWINFGSYASRENNGVAYWPTVVGFTGLGTLGGGNAAIRVEGDAGVVALKTTAAATLNNSGSTAARSEGVTLAIGSTGRVLDDGRVVLTGGGDLDVRLGGGWNSHLDARLSGGGAGVAQTHELYGSAVNLRGAINLTAGQIGTVELFYGAVQDAKELRAADPTVATASRATGGLMLMQGDASASITSRGDLVLGGTGDPGLVITPNGTAFTSAAGNGQMGTSWFTLWTDRTALQLVSAGGQLAFDTRASETSAQPANGNWDYTSNGGWFLLPGKVSALAATGSIYYGSSASYGNTSGGATQWNTAGLLLAPLGERRIELLAGQSLYGGGQAISNSGADSAIMATVQHPAFAGYDMGASTSPALASNGQADGALIGYGLQPLLAFGANTIGDAAVAATAAQPSRFYAVTGDIVGLRTGTVVNYTSGLRAGQHDQVAAGPVSVKAGRDIVYTGTRVGDSVPLVSGLTSDDAAAAVSGNLIINTHPNDVSMIQAGRDILYANVDVAGPGTLEITAGRNLIQNDRANLTSIGPVLSSDARPGAGIVVQAGVGSQGADYGRLLAQYLDPANLAVAGTPLADQPGKVIKTYGAELADWLSGRYAFKGTAAEAMSFFSTLPPEQQRLFARQVFFAELREGGREYTAIGGPRTGSYLRGRNAIAAMFPNQNPQSPTLAGTGNLLMYGGAGIHTDLGGDIQVLTPAGAQTYGVEGAAPPATAGLITRGSGDIQLYALGSILLGQSRVMTTFGGDILAWSARGDINAGRGAKTTIVFTPPRRVYDELGNVSLSPDVPSTGAGIATLNPLAEVKAGDIDLIAPLGTVDAGEAGIRVSGNINIAALRVANAANIQVKGESAGLPAVAAVNVNALTSASTAASTAAAAAQEVLQREREAVRQQQPSTFTVRVLGLGNDPAPTPSMPASPPTSRAPVPYDPSSPVQIVGHGKALDPAVMAQLTEAERRALANKP
ncbi:filamentous haemagglutinin family protein [Roseateles amylovorans]|uniref:Filamentous hemagglutinin family protein n=1 Tax=Roseateles amylovorans TaxID=2978473 RepID=A0ABY6B0A8_9BURK|nr:filamentous haemagglutinin family protein [Roseateles amylovorans]UXH77419.1 filamentous hemagglutinin family protein [Roseateles amylovorans]